MQSRLPAEIGPQGPIFLAGAKPTSLPSVYFEKRVRFAYPPYKTPPLSHGGCASLTRPTKRHLYRMAGARRLLALQNATLIVGWVSAAHPPFLCHTIKTRPLKPSQKYIPATLTIIFIYLIGALHINVAPLHHNETTYYLKEGILKIKQK
ncbi:hypothetical protein SMX74_001088 [Cronobacter sakazakii]|uniref:hypothetical protein n=1 Tax=Cronobacter sakazakii TaxID=28141 RepID=UPI00131A0808|nr:hypothetical protein [Cronobacter sakazakii]EKK3974812.1 hypothetical protein [Cronobacter sakazakii]ELY3780195.1 hypothetical protein [Cronobacter sakazakii]